MKKFHIVLLALLMLSLSVSAFGDSWKTFNSDVYGYSLKYPDGWEVGTSDDKSFSVTTAGNGLMPTVIMVMVEDVDDSDYDMSFEETMQEALKDIEDELANEGMGMITIKDQEAVDVNGHEAYWVEMNISLMGLFNMRMDMYMFQHNDHMIILSFNGDPDTFDENSEVFDTVVQSFKLK